MKKRHYNNGDAEFILEPLSDSVVRVTHRDQTGYFGIKKDWEAARLYTWINWESGAHDDGISASFSYSYPPPEAALYDLCRLLLRQQGKDDSKRTYPKLVNDNYFVRLCASYSVRSGSCVTVVPVRYWSGNLAHRTPV